MYTLTGAYEYLSIYVQNPYRYQKSLYHEGKVIDKCL